MNYEGESGASDAPDSGSVPDSSIRDPEPGPVIVRHYGLLPPLDWADDCHEHLFLQNKLWNRLVEIEKESRDKYRAVADAAPGVAALVTQLEDVVRQREVLKSDRKLLRKQARKRVPTPDIDTAIAALSAQVTTLSAEIKQARAAAKSHIAGAVAAIDHERKLAVKVARNESGLWWGNYNAVCASYERARRAAIKSGSELRFHRFDGSGRFTVQLQGGLSLDHLYGGEAIVSIRPLSQDAFTHLSKGARRRAQRTIVTITLYTTTDAQGKRSRRSLSFPMIMHRPIPADARIKEVQVVRRRVGTSFRWGITFTCRGAPHGAAQALHPATIACGIDLGWRKVPRGLRVATIVGSDGSNEYVVLPTNLLRRFDRIAELSSDIDLALNSLKQWMVNEAISVPEALASIKTSFLRVPTPRLLAKLVYLWRRDYPAEAPTIFEHLDEQRKAVKFLQNERDNLRENGLAARTDLYKKTALAIATRYSAIVVEDFDLREVAKKADDDNDPRGKGNIPEPRKMRQYAAVSDLRRWIEIQAKKVGARMVVAKAAYSTTTCHRCGARAQGDRFDIVWRCHDCGATWDQDINAAKNLLSMLTLPTAGEQSSADQSSA